MASEHVIDVTQATFQQDVAQFSLETPVLIDFWAEWCGPCKQVGPILEKLASEYNGAFRLAKINTDTEPELAGAFGVQSIPTMVLFYGGQPADSFPGARTEPEMRQYLDSVFEQLGVTVTPKTTEPDGPPTDPAAARAYWQTKLDTNAADGEALLELGRLDVHAGEIESAQARFKTIEAVQDQYSAAQAALATLSLLEEVGAAGGEAAVREQAAAAPDDARLQYLVACADAGRGAFALALAVFVGLVGNAPEAIAADAKKAAAVVFQAAGREDPEIEASRRKLARLLF